MAVVEAFVTFIRLDTNAAYASGGESTGDVTMGQRDRVLDGPEHIHIEIPLLSTLGIAIVNATGGPSFTDKLIPLFGKLSFDGGATTDTRFVLVSAQRVMDPSGPKLIIDQYDKSIVFSTAATDRETFVNAVPNDVFNAPAGTVGRPKGSIGLAGMPTWPGVKGLYQTSVGAANWAGKALLAMRAVFADILAIEPLSLDVNASSITNSTKAAAARLAGIWHASDTVAPGARAHYVSMTGDTARNPDGLPGEIISIGRVGGQVRCTFDGDTPGTWDETTTISFTGTGLAYNPMFSEMVPQVSMIGGISNHGISDGQDASGAAATSITAMVVVNTNRQGSAALAWDTNLPIVGTSSGVYYHPVGCGFLVPMSPVIAVTAMAHNAAAATILIATPSGVFSMSATPPKPFLGLTNTLTRVGGITFAVDDLWLDSTGNIFIRVGGNQTWKGASVDGVYCFPALSGDISGDSQGYAGWSRLAHSSAILTCGGNINDLYYCDSNKANTVYHLQPGSTAKPVASTVAVGQSIIGIDTVLTVGPSNAPDQAVYQQVFVRTDAGNQGLYHIQAGTDALLLANADNSLSIPSDTTGQINGQQVQIRKIIPSGVTVFGEYIFAFAATDAGVFRTADSGGNAWSSPNAESGLGDFDISFIACGTVQTVLGHPLHRIFAGSSRQLLISCDAGDSWRDMLADKLDTGAAWYRRAVQWNTGTWPDNNVGALGTVYGQPQSGGSNTGSILGGGANQGAGAIGFLSPNGSDDTGGTGSVLAPPSTITKGLLPAGVIRARRLDEQQQFVFRMVDLNSEAPQPGILYDEESELQASANVGVITASEQVELDEWRALSGRSIKRFQMPIQGSFTQTNAIARDLAPTDMVRLKYNPAGWAAVMAVDMHLLVVSHSIVVAGGLGRVTSVISNSLESGPLDMTTWAAAQEDKLVNKIRWGSA